MIGPYQGKRVTDTHYVRNWRPSSPNSGFLITNEKYRDCVPVGTEHTQPWLKPHFTKIAPLKIQCNITFGKMFIKTHKKQTYKSVD